MDPCSTIKHTKESTKVAKKKGPLTKATKKCPTQKTQNSQNILKTINEFHAIGITKIKRTLLAKTLGYSNLGSLANKLAPLRKQGLVENPCKGTVQSTEAGREGAEDILVNPTNKARQDLIRTKLKGKPLEIFNVICDGNTYSREELKEKTHSTHVQDNSYDNNFGPLNALEILEYIKDESGRKRKLIRLKPSAGFPAGHPYS